MGISRSTLASWTRCGFRDLTFINEKDSHFHEVTKPSRMLNLFPDGRISYSVRYFRYVFHMTDINNLYALKGLNRWNYHSHLTYLHNMLCFLQWTREYTIEHQRKYTRASYMIHLLDVDKFVWVWYKCDWWLIIYQCVGLTLQNTNTLYNKAVKLEDNVKK